MLWLNPQLQGYRGHEKGDSEGVPLVSARWLYRHLTTLLPAKPNSVVTEHFDALESDVVRSAAIEYRSCTQ